ncbi:MAG TPA: AMP-binding protein, partial [Acidimicrobiales bacterium]|nr:AMP-binding protein [Acidimicrobiales bacterium]
RYRQPHGAWDVPTLDALITAHPVGGGPAVVDGERRIDADQLEHMVAGLAGGLRRSGVCRGDVVTWQLPNWLEALMLFRACWRCGAVAAPLHHQMGAAEVEHMVEVLEPTLAFASPALPLSGRDGAALIRGGDDHFEALLSAPPVRTSPNRPSDLAVVIFTSGSTGRPKAVLHTHRSLAYKALTMTGVHGLSGEDAVLMPAPLAHISGLLNGVLVPGTAAMRTVLMERWDVERGLGLMGAEHISFMIGPPTMFTGIMAAPQFSPGTVASMRVVSSGMMGVSPAFIDAAHEGLGAIVKRSYGSTEAPTVSTCTNLDPQDRCRDTDGRAVGQAEIRVVDPASGRSRRAGQVGEVLIRGPELFAGYAEQADTSAAMHRGWFRSGDLGVLDEHGWLTITGRLKELIIRGGENISSAEVEQALELHPGISQAVVVGRPDDRLGEQVVAFVVGPSEIDVAECRRWFAEQGVARFKTPEVVVPVGEVPLLAAGKPDRTALKARAAALVVAP